VWGCVCYVGFVLTHKDTCINPTFAAYYVFLFPVQRFFGMMISNTCEICKVLIRCCPSLSCTSEGRRVPESSAPWSCFQGPCGWELNGLTRVQPRACTIAAKALCGCGSLFTALLGSSQKSFVRLAVISIFFPHWVQEEYRTGYSVILYLEIVEKLY